MTKNEFNALKYINQHTRTEGYPPSYQEIADYLLIKSRANIHRIVESLMKQRPGVFSDKSGQRIC